MVVFVVLYRVYLVYVNWTLDRPPGGWWDGWEGSVQVWCVCVVCVNVAWVVRFCLAVCLGLVFLLFKHCAVINHARSVIFVVRI